MQRIPRWLPFILIVVGLIVAIMPILPQQQPLPTVTPFVPVFPTEVIAAATATQTAVPASPTATNTTTNTPTATATNTPTATTPPTATNTNTPTATNTPTPSPIPSPTVTPTLASAAPSFTPNLLGPIPFRTRFGATGGLRHLGPALNAGVPVAHFTNWQPNLTLPDMPAIRFWQMVRVSNDGLQHSLDDIKAVIEAHPGSVWIIGNEPDVTIQDNVTPERYATVYHDAYAFIKGQDATALIAIAGVSQPTPLRRTYLDRVLESYQAQYSVPMPIDIWTVHGFIFREETGNWGAGIPPGIDPTGAKLYEIDDHGNIDIFRQNLLDFRAWMANRGYGDHPLALTEYGIVMPPDYGYPPQRVADFLTQSFDFMLGTSNSTGYAPDGGRLVQWWFWFSLYEPSDGYSTGNLYNARTGELTYLGQTWANYINGQ